MNFKQNYLIQKSNCEHESATILLHVTVKIGVIKLKAIAAILGMWTDL